MTKRLLITVSVLYLAISILRAQDLEVSSVSLPSSFNPSTICGMAQDQIGNIWLATNNQGLFKYNGESYSLYNNERNNSNSLISDRLECIHADKAGNIWIGSFAVGLSRLDPNTESFTSFRNDPNDPKSIRSNSIRSFAEDNTGRLWIGTLNGIDYWDPETGSFRRDYKDSPDARILSEEHVRTMLVDRAGILWAGSSSPFFGEQSKGGLFRIDPSTMEVKRYARDQNDAKSLSNNTVTSIFEDSRGTFWVGTAGDGLHTMDREVGEFTTHLYDPAQPNKLSRPPVEDFNYALDHIRFIQEDMHGRVWIGTMNSGMNRYDPISNTVQHFGTEESDEHKIPYNDLWASMLTEDNLMWVTGWSPGNQEHVLFKINLAPIVLNHVTIDKKIYSFAEDNLGNIYMGGENYLIRVNTGGNENVLLSFEDSDPIYLNHINLDARGNLWISTNKGLLEYRIATGEAEVYPLYSRVNGMDFLTSINVTDHITTDSLLIGSINGVFLFDISKKEFFEIVYNSNQINQQIRLFVQDIHVDSRNNYWIGFSTYGLKKLEKDLKTFIDYTFLTTVQDGPRDIYEDHNQNLYVGNWRSGFRMYDYSKDQFELISDNAQIIDEETSIGSITSINDSMLLLGTSNGLIRFNLSSNSAFIFEVGDLENIEFTNDDIFSASNGDFYKGTSEGYLKFRPEDFENKTSYKAKPSISKLIIQDQNMTSSLGDESDKIELPYDQNNISFTLSYIDFINQSSDKSLQYFLENYDQNWRVGKNEDEVSYYQLSPGRYTFRLKAVDSYGDWSEEVFSFKIKPPWWRTWWAYLLYVILIGVLARRFHLYQKERLLKAEHERNREKELSHAREIEKAYSELKATQSQLIQSEKMASLGELTAGIAHEIQNPLNFVNNFSEINKELLEELREEIDNGNLDEVKELALNAIANEDKILQHGRRADSIVKAMLQHSRMGSGEKSPTDINALCEEYIRLAYHGLRAKEPEFNADYETQLDRNIPLLNVVSQDISRVLLNLINNAFQALQENQPNRGGEYKPKVIVRTKLFSSSLSDGGGPLVRISVIDNGPGVPDNIKDKIFQPFFTTKPTGQGTGLGLSLSYDIVKSHGGELSVESNEGEGSVFRISLPIESKITDE